MSDRNELEQHGLEPPDDTSGLSEAELLALADEKKRQFDDGFVIHFEKAKNHDPKPTELTPEALLAREAAEKERQASLKAKREQASKLDREVLSDRWAKKVPPSFQSAVIEDLPVDLHKLCTNWLYGETDCKRNLILTGATGVGKTYTGYAIGRELYITRNRIMIKSMAELLDDIRPGGQRAAFEKYQKVPYLMIDDLGVEKNTEWVAERLYMLFDYRWKWCYPMIITTNVPADDFFDVFGERVTSRMLDGALGHKIEGHDRRLTDE